MQRFFLVLAGALLLAACSQIDHGTLHRRWKQPAHVEAVTTYVMCGKVMVPITTHRNVPDKWFVEIHQIDEDGYDHWRTVEITEREFDSLRLGSEYKVKD